MPEGDTLHRTAARLRLALAGEVAVEFDAPRLTGERPALPQPVESVEAEGKHLLVTFAEGLVLETHLGMPGSWHLYRRGERWRRPRHQLRALVGTGEWQAACFLAPLVRTWRRDDAGTPLVRGPMPVTRLGPDLCRPDPDLDDMLDRLARLDPATEIGVALLDQRVASGIGNVYKSEVLWACRVDPFAPVGALDGETRRSLYECAARLLQANLTTARRTTRPGGGVAVYRRAGAACPRCGTHIVMRYQGVQQRSTYWCPSCQEAGTRTS